MCVNMRNNWLDIAKGVAIILMVMGHSTIPHALAMFIWAFHMPLFFIAAGWSTDWKKRSVKNYILHRMKTLMLPFFTYSIIVTLILSNHDSWKGLSHLLCNGWEGYPLWFIPVLFVASVICRLVYEVRGAKMRIMIMILLAFAGMTLHTLKVNLPWTMSTVPYASFLVIGGGMCLKRFSYQLENPKTWVLLLCFLTTLIVSMLWRMDLAWNRISPIIPLTVGAVSGTFMVFIVASLIDMKSRLISRVLSAIGKETYVVVAFASAIIMMQNQYFTINPLVKYCVMILALCALVKVKNIINKALKFKLL